MAANSATITPMLNSVNRIAASFRDAMRGRYRHKGQLARAQRRRPIAGHCLRAWRMRRGARVILEESIMNRSSIAKVCGGAALLLAFGVQAADPVGAAASLYDQLGGQKTISKMGGSLLKSASKDPRLA